VQDRVRYLDEGIAMMKNEASLAVKRYIDVLLQLKSPNPNHVYIVIDKLFALKNALRAVEGEMGVWSDSGNNYTTRIGPHTYAYDDDDILPTSESLENFLGPSLPPYAMHARAHC